jgi:hypothetical protein
MQEAITYMMKKDTASLQETARITGDMLNERLDGQILAIERVSILLEDAKLDPNDVMALDNERMGKLMELLSAYEALLEHFRYTTEDTVAAIKGLTTAQGRQCCCDGDFDDNMDADEELQE